jgi:hypothetical protein
LANPPRCVRRELEALPPIELLDSPDEAQIAFLDQVEQVKPPARVPLGNGDDQAKVAPDELLLGVIGLSDEPDQLDAAILIDVRPGGQFLFGSMTTFDSACEANLVLGGE